MKTLATLLSLAVLVTVSTCMSLQEYEDDEMTSNNPSWGIHLHFHFWRMKAETPKVVTCTGGKCNMCAQNMYEIEISNEVKISIPFDGCLVISKEGDKQYGFELSIANQKYYKNTYEEFNSLDILPCITTTLANGKDSADLCPVLYEVDKANGKICARIDENVRLQETALRHVVDLGCTEFK